MPRVGFEPTISAGERPKSYALDRAATGTGGDYVTYRILLSWVKVDHHCHYCDTHPENNHYSILLRIFCLTVDELAGGTRTPSAVMLIKCGNW